MGNNSTRATLNVQSVSLPTTAPPSLLSYHHPSSLFALEVEHCWLCSICLFLGLGFSSSLSLSFLPLIPFLVTYPALLIPRYTNTPPLHILPSLHPSANSTCLLPIKTEVILSSSCQCRGERERRELSHNNIWRD